MTRFNLSEWAVHNRAIVVFLMLVCVIGGISAYERLGRQEDPDFTVQTMVVQAVWPGATAADMLTQVTDRLEKKLEETPKLDYIKSYTKPGQATIFVYLKESTPKRDLDDIWYQVRKKVSDVQATLPPGVVGPFFNDEFGDVFGIIYGITYDGFTPREARDFAETARTEFLRSSDVGKVEIFGDQDEKVYLSFSPQKLANLKLSLDEVLTAIARQNAVVPSGVINTPHENMLVDVTGSLLKPESVADLNLWIDGRFYKLTDIAKVQRGYSDPPTKMFRVNGKPAIGIGVNMREGGNNLDFGEGLHEAAERLMQRFPVGIELNLVSDQPEVVREAIGEFTKALFEAIVIVLAVSFLSLGFRAGLVVALSIPLVLAIVFIAMEAMGISLQRISLGALIIALGLLVDDAMITIEMMISKIEEGMEKIKAATFAYTSTAFPMLSGTLITILGFLPIGFADNNTGQYTFSLFAVIAVALVASWFVAVIFAPVIGLSLLPSHMKAHGTHGPGRFMRAFIGLLGFSMRHRWLTIAASLAAFGASLYGMGFVQQQFFPASNRPELVVTMTLPKNASIAATETRDEAAGRGACQRPGHRRLLFLCGRRRHPLLPAARRPARQRLHGGDRGRREGPRGAGPRSGEARDAVCRQLPGREGPHLAPGARAARRLAGAIPGERADGRRGEGSRGGARKGPAVIRPRAQRQLRLGREEQGAAHRRRSGSRASGRPELGTARPGTQPRDQRLDGHPASRLDLSGRCRGAGREQRALER